MHSLAGSFIKEMEAQTFTENGTTETYYPIEIRLSHICKRVLFFLDKE